MNKDLCEVIKNKLDQPHNKQIPSKTPFKSGVFGFLVNFIQLTAEKMKASRSFGELLEKSHYLFLELIKNFLNFYLDAKFKEFCLQYLLKINEQNNQISLPGDSSLKFHVNPPGENEQSSQETAFEIKLPGFSQTNEENSEPPLKLNLMQATDNDFSNENNEISQPLKINLGGNNNEIFSKETAQNNKESSQKFAEKINFNPINLPMNKVAKNSPTRKIIENSSLSKSSSEKVLIPVQKPTQKNENISPKSILRRANSAYNKTAPKFTSKDDSKLNYNERPLDYLFSKGAAKKNITEKEVKEFEDIPSPSEKANKEKDVEGSLLTRKLSNSLAVSISPKAKDSSNLGGNFSLNLKPQSLNDSMDSGSKKYKVVMINKSMSS